MYCLFLLLLVHVVFNLYSSYSGLEINGATNFNVRYILIIFTL